MFEFIDDVREKDLEEQYKSIREENNNGSITTNATI